MRYGQRRKIESVYNVLQQYSTALRYGDKCDEVKFAMSQREAAAGPSLWGGEIGERLEET